MKANKIIRIVSFVLIVASLITFLCLQDKDILTYSYSSNTGTGTQYSITSSDFFDKVYGTYGWVFYVAIAITAYLAAVLDNKVASTALSLAPIGFVCPIFPTYAEYLRIINNFEDYKGYANMSLENMFFVTMILLISIVVFSLVILFTSLFGKKKD